VDGRQGARPRALLLLVVAGAARALGPGQDAARGDKEDMAVRELLLELARQAGKVSRAVATLARNKVDSPLLDPVEALQGRDGDKDDNSLLAVANFELIEKPKVSMRAPGPSHGPLPVLLRTIESMFIPRNAQPSFVVAGACLVRQYRIRLASPTRQLPE